MRKLTKGEKELRAWAIMPFTEILKIAKESQQARGLHDVPYGSFYSDGFVQGFNDCAAGSVPIAEYEKLLEALKAAAGVMREMAREIAYHESMPHPDSCADNDPDYLSAQSAIANAEKYLSNGNE